MTNEPVTTDGERSLDVFESSLKAELAVERRLMRSIIKGTLIGIPIGVILCVGILAAAISDKREWYVWVGLGAGIGMVAAILFGVLGAVTLSAPALEDVDRRLHDA